LKVLLYDRSRPELQEVLQAMSVRNGGSGIFLSIGKLPVYKAYTFQKTAKLLSKYMYVLK